MALSKAIELITPDKVPHPKGVHASAVIAKNASVGTNAAVGAYAVIDTGAVIGDNTVIYPFAYIGKNAKIGGDCIIYPHVTIREDIMIGNRVIIHPGSVVGSDGFGYDTKPDGSHAKIPHLGTVVIEDDVEIGACVTIDRARFEKTVIGKGSKIDNLVQIAHNVKIGPYCLIAGQSGISGSSELGRNVVFAGQVGMADHAKLGDFAVAGAKTGIPKKSYPPKTVLFGYPAKPIDKAKEIIASTALLPKLFERVRVLEEKLKKITQK
jgi:UDP-3-O-[3-hydroxymyristoyl] glucosamine N-acyltransferase